MNNNERVDDLKNMLRNADNQDVALSLIGEIRALAALPDTVRCPKCQTVAGFKLGSYYCTSPWCNRKGIPFKEGSE